MPSCSLESLQYSLHKWSDKRLFWLIFRSQSSVKGQFGTWISIQWVSLISMCVHALDENGIVFEVEVSRDEALATLELYKQTCPGLFSLSSLQGVLQAMDRGGVRTCTYTHETLRPLLFTWSPTNWLFLLLWCVQHLSLVYRGRRSRTKSDLSMKMYEEEIQVRNWRRKSCIP